MRKGFSLIEIIVVLSIMAMVLIPIAALNRATLYEIPRAHKILQSHSTLLHFLRYIQKDINIAKGFPESFNSYVANNETFLIELEQNTLCYQFTEGKIQRLILDSKTAKDKEIVSWQLPYSKIDRSVWRKDGRAYAVEIETYIEQKRAGRLQKKMSNSHLYFVGAYREAEN